MPAELRTVGGQISKRRRLGPQLIGCYTIESELLRYLREQIQTRWPWCRLDPTTAADALSRWQVDLWLSASVPVPLPARPLLLLSPPARADVFRCLAPGLWELSAPYCRDTLLTAVEKLWREGQS